MTFANVITLVRFALIPIFAWVAAQYGQTVDAASPIESLRWTALTIYITASVLDGIDGWVARRFDQQSEIGAALDPIADKLLLMTGLAVATFVNWGTDWHLPNWFIILVISRDIMILGGVAYLHYLNGKVPITPHWSGKICTVTQMIAMGWIMLKFTDIDPLFPTILATIFTLLSAFYYFQMGLRQLPKT